MPTSARVYTDVAELSDLSRGRLASEGLVPSIVVDAAELRTPLGRECVDLLHVPVGGWLDPGRAENLLAHSGAERFGILSEDAGLVVHGADRRALRLYYRPPAAGDDEPVYLAGAEHRSTCGADRSVPAPRQVYLGLTQRCNRSCTFCVSRTFDFDLLSIEQVERLCDELASNIDIVALTGAGEAMTHPRFWEILDLLCDRLPGVRFKMNTSGVALTRKARRLLGYPLRNITVSLNAGTAATYERFVGPGFDAVLRGIASVVRERAELGRTDLRLCLSMVLMNATVGEMAQVASIAAEHGVEEVQGIYLMINDDVLASESLWHQPERSNALLDAAARHAAALGVQASLPPRFRTGHMHRDRDQVASLPTTQGQRCTEAWSTVYVRPDGDVIACPYMETPMGNIRRAGLMQVWNGAAYADLRKGLVDGPSLEECRHCCGFNEGGAVDEYRSHWLGTRQPGRILPLVAL